MAAGQWWRSGYINNSTEQIIGSIFLSVSHWPNNLSTLYSSSVWTTTRSSSWLFFILMSPSSDLPKMLLLIYPFQPSLWSYHPSPSLWVTSQASRRQEERYGGKKQNIKIGTGCTERPCQFIALAVPHPFSLLLSIYEPHLKCHVKLRLHVYSGMDCVLLVRQLAHVWTLKILTIHFGKFHLLFCLQIVFKEMVKFPNFFVSKNYLLISSVSKSWFARLLTIIHHVGHVAYLIVWYCFCFLTGWLMYITNTPRTVNFTTEYTT